MLLVTTFLVSGLVCNRMGITESKLLQHFLIIFVWRYTNISVIYLDFDSHIFVQYSLVFDYIVCTLYERISLLFPVFLAHKMSYTYTSLDMSLSFLMVL